MALKLVSIAATALLLGSSGAIAQTPATKVATASARPATADPKVNALGTAVKAFQDRIAEYVALQHKVDDGIPKLTETNDPAKIAARERALGEALIKARPNAQPGEYFVKEYQPFLIQTIKSDFAKRTRAERKALIVELPKGLKLGVNMIYPTTIPLATFPPNLLKALPELPPELEYRIVYRHLILRDVKGNYVVDMMPDVFPIPM
jgi:hypothetical protein